MPNSRIGAESIGHLWSSIITKSVHGEPSQEPIVRNDCFRPNRPFMIVALEGGYVPRPGIRLRLQSTKAGRSDQLPRTSAPDKSCR
jgi:hypothetical protein